MKRCTKCKRKLPKSEFRKDRSKKDGLYSSCNDCYRRKYGTKKLQRELLGKYKNLPVYRTSAHYPMIDIGKRHLVRAHRFIMENTLGRKIRKNEQIHHVDFNKDNWKPENLMLMNKSEHHKLHSESRKNGEYRTCRTCKKERYFNRYCIEHPEKVHLSPQGIYQCAGCFIESGGGAGRRKFLEINLKELPKVKNMNLVEYEFS